MSTQEGPSTDWRISRVRDDDEVLRWRALAAFPSGDFVLGISSDGRLLRMVEATQQVIPFSVKTSLCFLGLLDNEYREFAEITRINAPSLDSAIRTRLNEMVTSVLVEALSSRAQPYIESALRWCEVVRIDHLTKHALRELASSERGTQQSRHAARRLARRSGV
jgi:hypothetical protein